jgi:hypothetical protein
MFMSMTRRVVSQRMAVRSLTSGTMLLGLSGFWAVSPVLAADTLTINASNEGAALEWHFPGVLQHAAGLTNGWADLPPCVTSITVPITQTALFFRVRKPLFAVVDTAQTSSYNHAGAIAAPSPGQPFHGQDPQYAGPAPSYTNNGDGTIGDLTTGLTWVQARGSRATWAAAVAGAATDRTGGYDDWRMPTIKELYSLIKFNGVNGPSVTSTAGYTPFIETNYFGFAYGSGVLPERVIDCQDWTATEYVTTTMNGDVTIFGVNFADGRIKGYPRYVPGGGLTEKTMYYRYVRGNVAYGTNSFASNGDGTITDLATALMWAQADSGVGLDWSNALAWVQARNAENHLGHNDWRLPNIKELQSTVDYTRSPTTTGTAAIDTNFFACTTITNEAGQPDYPYYWSGTILLDGGPAPSGTYISFGRAMGYMNGSWMDVHGAGSQKSDILVGDPASYPTGRGPQGDAVRIYNYVRLVRGGLSD